MSLTDEEAILKAIGRDGYDVEHSMDPLHRKQTGSYYTNIESALAMMEEMVGSLPAETKNSLFSRTFLEPCVGTGNFVFAYLRVCRELGFTAEEYKTLLNNIYVCDINGTALAVYRKNLTLLAREWFGFEPNDRYFATHIGSGLLVNVDDENIRYIPITEVFSENAVKSGFDFVVTNPKSRKKPLQNRGRPRKG